jgi:hypothetical protein
MHGLENGVNPVGRVVYLLAGAILFGVKFGIDWTVAHLAFRRPWSPADYVAPGASLGFLLTAPNERIFYLTMLLIALPFIACGIWLTAMRLRSAGLRTGWTILFFVPGVNFGMFALLSALPAREETKVRVAEPVEPPSPHSGIATPLAYADKSAIPAPTWLDRVLPVNPGAAKAVAVLAPVPIALAATFASIRFLDQYGWGVFVGVPFAIGLMSAVLYAARSPRGRADCIGVGCLSLTVYGVALLMIAFEGAGCLIMAAPIAYPIAMIGAAVGASLGSRPTRLRDAGQVVGSMLLFLPMFIGAEKLAAPKPSTYAVTTSVDVDAPPSRVWANVIGFGEIPAPGDWIFRSGIAYPVRAEISGRGAGAVRRCVFSTGAFVEPISVWDEPRLLKFIVTSNPPPMTEWSPWGDIHPPHLNGFLVSSGGQFKLVPLPDGRTRLEGTTWYRHHMWPAPYWRLWSDFIIHRIHLRVLNHVKMLSERAKRAAVIRNSPGSRRQDVKAKDGKVVRVRCEQPANAVAP